MQNPDIPQLTRDAVVRAYNIVAFSNGHKTFKSLLPQSSLAIAQAILENYETPTPFKNKPQRGVSFPQHGFRYEPTARRPSFEENSELGHPAAWVPQIEGYKTARKAVAKEVEIFDTLTKDFAQHQLYYTWRLQKNIAPPQTLTSQQPDKSTPSENNDFARAETSSRPELSPNTVIHQSPPEQRFATQSSHPEDSTQSTSFHSYRDTATLLSSSSDSSSVNRLNLQEELDRAEDFTDTGYRMQRDPSSASVNQEEPQVNKKRRNRGRKKSGNRPPMAPTAGNRQANMPSTSMREESSLRSHNQENNQMGHNAVDDPDNMARERRDLMAQPLDRFWSGTKTRTSLFTGKPGNPNLEPLGSRRGNFNAYVESERETSPISHANQRTQSREESRTQSHSESQIPREKPATASRAQADRQDSVTREEFQSTLLSFKEEMKELLKDHFLATTARQEPPQQHRPTGFDNPYVMSGANGPPQSRPHSGRLSPTQQYNPGTRVPDSPMRNTRGNAYDPYHIRDFNSQEARYGEDFYPAPPRYNNRQPYANNGNSFRELTPQEMRIAEDNERVRAMGGTMRFHPDTIGFFWPNMPRDEYPDDVTDITGKTYFRNVRDFLDAAKVVIAAQCVPEHVVRHNLHQCFKGNAQLWYQTNPTLERRKQAVQGRELENWEELLKPFRTQPREALKRLQNEKYTPSALVNGREPTEWFVKVKRLCQDAGFGDGNDNHYVNQAWNLMDARIRIHLQEPSVTMTSDDFLFMLEEKKNTLLDVFRFESSKYAPRATGVSGSQGSYNPANANSDRGRQFGTSSRPQNRQSDYNQSRPDNKFQNASAQYNKNAQRSGSKSRPWPPQSQNRSDQNPNQGTSSSQDARSKAPNSGGSYQRYNKLQGTYHNREVTPQEPVSPNRSYTFGQYEGAIPERNISPRPQASPFRESDSFHSGREQASPNDSNDFHPSNWAPEDTQYNNTGEDGFQDPDELNQPAFVGRVTQITQKVSMKGPNRVACRTCGVFFASNNKLHAHVRQDHMHETDANVFMVTLANAEHTQRFTDGDKMRANSVGESLKRIVKSAAPPPVDGVTTFRNWHELKMHIKSNRSGTEFRVCLDTGAAITLIDEAFAIKNFPTAKWQNLKEPVRYAGTGPGRMTTSTAVYLTIYVPSKTESGEEVLALWRVRAYAIPDLAPNMLLGMDTLVPQGVIIDIAHRVLRQPLCEGVLAQLVVTAKDLNAQKIRKMYIPSQVIIPPHSAMSIRLKASGALSPNCDYILEPLDALPFRARVYATMLNTNTMMAAIRNDTDKSVRIQRNATLGHAVPMDAEAVYHLDSEDHAMAALPELRRPSGMEHKTKQGITIYGTKAQAEGLKQVILQHPESWEDRGSTVRVPEEYWMPIDLKDGWQEANMASKIYPSGPRDRACIDKVLEKLEAQGKLLPATKPAPFPVPVFVVWKKVTRYHPDGTEYTEMKGRPVLDMRELNKWVIKDTYPLTTQKDIISRLHRASYISVIDGMSFFYQFAVQEKDRTKFTINTHRGAEILNVCAMGFKNSVAHVQRCGDLIFRDMATFVKPYIDDFTIHSNSYDEHCEHLTRFLNRAWELGMSLNPEKAFIGFPSVKLLGQHVDAFGISSTEERIKALKDIKFPRHARDLERYIGAVNFLNDRTPYLARIAEPLTTLKTELLRHAPKVKGRRRTQAAINAKIPAEGPIRDAFEQIQSLWEHVFRLVHHDPGRPLYIDVDSSKEYGMALMAYHVLNNPEPIMVDSDIPEGYEDDEPSPTAWLKRSLNFDLATIQPIVFLSKCLSSPERRYFPTELEMSGLCWAVKKLRHLIETAPKTFVFTDHAAVTAIAKQHKLTRTESLECLNLKLAKTSIYLQQFELDVRYRPGRLHLVPDALSRLPPNTIPGSDLQTDILDDVAHVFHTLIVEMSDTFKERLKQAYQDDVIWKRTLDVISGSQQDQAEPIRPLRGLRFLLKEGLIYHWDKVDGAERLCVPKELAPEIFAQAHDDLFHQGFQRAYTRIKTSFYIRKLAKYLKLYIKYCPKCKLTQTVRHPPHGSLEPLDKSSRPFEVVCIDIVTHMPETSDGFNAFMTETCHASKAVNVIPGKDTWSSEEWSNALLKTNYTTTWGHPKVIISDRDPKFIKGLMSRRHTALGMKFHTTAAWHPSADGQSERSNQTVAIALRFFVTENPDADWVEAIPHIQFTLNTSKNASLGCTPCEYIMGFNPYHGFDLTQTNEPLSAKDYEELRVRYRDEASQALEFARVAQKYQHDQKHRPLILKPGEHVALKLHNGYNLKGNPPRKVGYQRIGPLEVLERISKNAYRIERPQGSRIHDVVNVTQLEPCHTVDQDPYHRPFPTLSSRIGNENEERDFKVIERIVKRRVHSATGELQYFVKWEDQPAVLNKWLSSAQMKTANEMRKDYDARFPLTDQETRKQARIRARQARKIAKDRRVLEPPPDSTTEHSSHTPPHEQQDQDLSSNDDAESVTSRETPPLYRRQRRPRLADRLNARGLQTIYNSNPSEDDELVEHAEHEAESGGGHHQQDSEALTEPQQETNETRYSLRRRANQN